MATTITDISGDKYAEISNSRFCRAPFPAFFSGWSKIRVALLLRIADSGGHITGTPRFGFGLCSGSANIPGDASVTHFVGALSNRASWTRATSSTRYEGLSLAYAAKTIGTTTTFGTSFNSGDYVCFHTTAPTMLFVDITKGSPNYSFTLFGNRGTSPGTVSLSTFLSVALMGTPAYANHVVYAGTPTVAVDEAVDGTLDHACVWWDQGFPAISLAAWRCVRLA